MRATLLSRQPWRGQEFMGGCASLWMNCASTQDGDAMPRDVPGAALSACRPITSANAGGLMGCGKIRKAAATVAAPDSYPHVTCGWGSQASADVPPAAGRRRIVHMAGSANRPGSRTGRGRACSGTGPGRTDGASRGQNKAHTTFPVWLGVVQPYLSLSAQMMCSPRPVSSREPGVRAAGAAVPGSATAHSTQGPGLPTQAEPDRPPGPGTAGSGQGVPLRVGQQLRHHDRHVRAAFCYAPGAGW